MEIPVTQVYAQAEKRRLSPIEVYKRDREEEWEKDKTTLQLLWQEGDVRAGEYLREAMERREKEKAVEGVLLTMGYANAVCALREETLTVCVEQDVEADDAQAIMEICENLTGVCAENVFLLDESAYSW
ncbi:MAG: SpoIIIAH-like family protein [Clostridia bacterium]|nr:SpoIIIAH-like family protein [Clostridia bacterium]